MPSIEKTGDWDGFARLLEQASSTFKKNVKRATDQAGRRLEKKIKDRIAGNQVQPATSAATKAWKEKHGYSDTTLIMTSDLLNAVNYQNKDWASGFVGVNRNAEGTGSSGFLASVQQDLVNIAALHEEYGVISKGGRVKRPFIGPVVESEGPKIPEFYQKAIEETFKK